MNNMTSWWTGPPLNFNLTGDFRVLRELVLLPGQKWHLFSLKRIKSEGKQSCFANDKVILVTHGRISLDLLPKKEMILTIVVACTLQVFLTTSITLHLQLSVDSIKSTCSQKLWHL
jgi:hypothetical protein